MRLVIVSDTHFMHDRFDIPDGDVLIHCGDSLMRGTVNELCILNTFLGGSPIKIKFSLPAITIGCSKKTLRWLAVS